jgi:hypothetical protein
VWLLWLVGLALGWVVSCLCYYWGVGPGLCWAVFLGVGMPVWESMSTREIAEFVAKAGVANISEGDLAALRLELLGRVAEQRVESFKDRPVWDSGGRRARSGLPPVWPGEAPEEGRH